MTPVRRLMPGAGLAVAVAGVVLMACSGPLYEVRQGVPIDAHPLTTMPLHVDWLLLIGMAGVVIGGSLVQLTWKRRSTPASPARTARR